MNKYKNINFVKIDDSLPISYNYIKACGSMKTPNSWDKALFYFNMLYNKSFEHIWFIEDDVFIPNNLLIKDIDERYKTEDLLCKEHVISTKDVSQEIGWGWVEARGMLELPWATSLAMVIRVSYKLMAIIKQYVQDHKRLVFIELIFNTLALQNRLHIQKISEMSELTFYNMFEVFLISKSVYHKNDKFYHSVKSIAHNNKIKGKLYFGDSYYDNLTPELVHKHFRIPPQTVHHPDNK